MEQSGTVAAFCCYAHKDADFLCELKTHLSPLERLNVIKVWDDGDISAGAEWGPKIKKHLNEAKIILLLISPAFINSDYCYSTEMQHALERHKQGEARVIPIIVRHIGDWKKVPPGDIQLGDLQALPKEGKPVKSWTDRDEAWKEVTEGINRVVNELLQTPPNRQKQIALDKVEKLVPGVDLSLYQETFGKATFKNPKSFFMNPNDEERKFVEYVFVDKYFYLNVIADGEGKVLYFAVTIRDKSFNPTLTKYFGRPGAYQDFGFGFNTAGYYAASSIEVYRRLLDTMHNCQGTLSDKEIEAVRAFSADEVFNTYAASAPGIWITNYAHIILGVNYDQVRILNS
jgi:TIR domain